MQGLADTLNVVHRECLNALSEHREDFEKQLDVHQTSRGEEAAALIAALAENLAQRGGPDAALRWFELTLAPGRSWGGLSNVYVPPREVIVQGHSFQLGHVLYGLREAA
jgi:hypothetical protein